MDRQRVIPYDWKVKTKKSNLRVLFCKSSGGRGLDYLGEKNLRGIKKINCRTFLFVPNEMSDNAKYVSKKYHY